MTKIACWDDFSEGFKVSGKKCPPSSEWKSKSNIAEGYSVEIDGSYADNQLVKYSDITVGIPFESTIYVGAYYAGFYPEFTIALYLLRDQSPPRLLANSDNKFLPKLELEEGYIDGSKCESYSYINTFTDSLGFTFRVDITGFYDELEGRNVYLYEDFPGKFSSTPDKDVLYKNSIGTFTYSSDDDNYVASFYYTNTTDPIYDFNGLQVNLIAMMESHWVQT